MYGSVHTLPHWTLHPMCHHNVATAVTGVSAAAAIVDVRVAGGGPAVDDRWGQRGGRH
jgi:hypothetical protein